MNTAYLGIGSNLPEAQARANIDAAIDALCASGCTVVDRSDVYVVNLPYYNNVSFIETDMDSDRLVSLTKDIETSLGRTPEMKSLGKVPVDIDVVIFNGKVKRYRDFQAEYFFKGYNKIRR